MPAFLQRGGSSAPGKQTGRKKLRAAGRDMRKNFHVNACPDEKKTGQTSDVFRKASKCFKALKRSAETLVYQ